MEKESFKEYSEEATCRLALAILQASVVVCILEYIAKSLNKL